MKRLVAILFALVIAGVAWSDPGTTEWTTGTTSSTSECSRVGAGTSCYLVVPVSSTVSSKVIRIQADSARICASSTASGTYVVHIVVNADTDAGSMIPSVDPASTLTSATGDCALVLRNDRVYVTVSSAPSGSADVLSIHGTD